MNSPWLLRQDDAGALHVCRPGGEPLFTYVFAPQTPAEESPRPYVHPLYSWDGDLLTNFRPNDHPWHHALSLTLTSVDGINFWGGPSFRAADRYQWRQDHGRQVHVEWVRQDAERLEHVLAWRGPDGSTLLRERRTLRVAREPGGWSLAWLSELENATGRSLRCDNYHSGGGLAGSHYTGLQFRGARGLLDEHGDERIKVTADGGREGEATVHGQAAQWLEWQAQHDTSLRRTRIRFESTTPIYGFVRRSLPLVALAPHRESPLELAPAAQFTLGHRLTFTRL